VNHIDHLWESPPVSSIINKTTNLACNMDESIFERISGWLLGIIAFVITGWLSMVKVWAGKRFKDLEDGHDKLSSQLKHHNEVLTEHDKRMEVSKVYMQGVRDDITEIKTNLKDSSQEINTKLDTLINGR